MRLISSYRSFLQGAMLVPSLLPVPTGVLWLYSVACSGSFEALPRLEDGHDGDDGGADADEEADTTTYLGTVDEDTFFDGGLHAGVTPTGQLTDDSSLVTDSDAESVGGWSQSEGGVSIRTPVPPPAQSLLLFDTTAVVKVRPMSRFVPCPRIC